MVDALTDRLPSEALARQADLSTRELEVLGLIQGGVLSTDDIAQRLCISPATAATHVQNILRKTALHSRVTSCSCRPRAETADVDHR